MKKALALLLTLAMLLGVAVGCSGDTDSNPSDSNPGNNNPSSDNNPSDNNTPSDNNPSGNTPDDTNPGDTNTPSTPGTYTAFDEFTRPRVKEDGKLTVGIIVMDIKADSLYRSLWQSQIECEHRGWTLVDGTCEGDPQVRDTFLNLMNQDVDAIIFENCSYMESYADIVAEARNKGIGVYCNDNQVIDGVISNCTMPNGVASMQLFYQIGPDLGWDINMGVIHDNNSQVHIERTYPVMSFADGVYPNVKLLAQEDIKSVTYPDIQASYEFAKTWMSQYGSEMNLIYTSWDLMGAGAAEAVIQAGDPHGEKTVVAGIDGGNTAWMYIRNNTPLKYTYSQPFEQFTHNVFEIIDQIQVKGLNPGDEGCSIAKAGDTLFFEGFVTTAANVPEIGQPIHAVFDYYGMDPDDPDAWFNWTDGPGIYMVAEGNSGDVSIGG